MAEGAEREIRRRKEGLRDALNKLDFDAAIKHFTKDAVVLEDKMKPLVGHDAIRENLKNSMIPGVTLAVGDLFYFELITETVAFTNGETSAVDPDGNTIMAFKDSFLWKKIGGEWYIDKDMFNLRPIPESPEQEIKKRKEGLKDALNKLDFDAAIKHFTKDAVVLEDKKNPLIGHDAIRENLEKSMIPGVTLAVGDLFYFELITDTVAFTNGKTSAVDKDGNTIMAFKDSFLWKKIDGEWYIDKDMFNLRPLPESK